MHTLSDDILKKIKLIQIQTRRLLSGSLVGDNRSAQKGVGFEFDQLRSYHVGDDVRFIDWRASARMDTLLVKQYVEERSRTIVIAVDVSASTLFSSQDHLKHDLLVEVACVLALVAEYGHDCVELILFSDRVEHYIPAARGKFHGRAIMGALFAQRPNNRKTKLSVALDHLARVKHKDVVAFILSDFIDDTDFLHPLRIAAKKCDLIAVRYLDTHEKELPSVGLLTIEDIETGESYILDTDADAKEIRRVLNDRLDEQDQLFKRVGVDVIDMKHSHSVVTDIVRFFRRRMRY